MTKDIELLPCPFCGGDATLQHAVTDDYRVVCEAMDCFGPVTSWYGLGDDAIAAWNRRSTDMESKRPAPAAPPLAVQDGEQPHLKFRREAFAIAQQMQPESFAGDLDEVDENTIEGMARTLAIVSGGYDWTSDEKGRLYACVAGDQGYAATGIVIDVAGREVMELATPPSQAIDAGDGAVLLRRAADEAYRVCAETRHVTSFPATITADLVDQAWITYVDASMSPSISNHEAMRAALETVSALAARPVPAVTDRIRAILDHPSAYPERDLKAIAVVLKRLSSKEA